MINLNKNDVRGILKFAESKIGDKYDKGYNCMNFIHDIYAHVGIECILKDFPEITLDGIYKEEFIGYICFLKHKIHVRERRFSHLGIIAPNFQLIHYSRYFGEPNVREVFKTSFEDIFKIYDFAHPQTHQMK